MFSAVAKLPSGESVINGLAEAGGVGTKRLRLRFREFPLEKRENVVVKLKSFQTYSKLDFSKANIRRLYLHQ